MRLFLHNYERMVGLNLHNAEFVKSAVKPSDFIMNPLPQIVFAGKSNVGKSSVINRILNRKNFARVGNTPGKTVHINYFSIDGAAYFVDLPGYGFAKVPKVEKDRWAKLMENYFATEGIVTLGIMIVDARHKPTADDVTMAAWFKSTGSDFVVVANKVDKVKKSQIQENMDNIRLTLQITDEVEVIPFSAETGEGRGRLIGIIESYV